MISQRNVLVLHGYSDWHVVLFCHYIVLIYLPRLHYITFKSSGDPDYKRSSVSLACLRGDQTRGGPLSLQVWKAEPPCSKAVKDEHRPNYAASLTGNGDVVIYEWTYSRAERYTIYNQSYNVSNVRKLQIAENNQCHQCLHKM